MDKRDRDRQICEAVANGDPIYEVADRFNLTPPVVGRIVRANGVIPRVNFSLENPRLYKSAMDEAIRNAIDGALREPRPRRKSRPEVEGSVLTLDNLITWCHDAQHLDVAYVTAPFVPHSSAMRAHIHSIGPFPGKRFAISRSGEAFKIACIIY